MNLASFFSSEWQLPYRQPKQVGQLEQTVLKDVRRSYFLLLCAGGIAVKDLVSY